MTANNEPKASTSMSEATLEARLHRFLSNAFPGVDLEHQRTFTIQLGHKTHEVGRQSRTGGRLDILLKHQGKPLAVVELKAPDEAVDEGVARQALSYARLVEPMAPLAIVTNSTDTIVLRTVDGARIAAGTFNEAAIVERFEDAGRLAGTAYDDAVRDLLGRDDALFAGLLNAASERVLERMTGDAVDLSRALCRDFSLPRIVVDDLATAIRDGDRFVMLVGSALSGRTNVLAQLCRRQDVGTIFIDATSTRHGPIRYMANEITAKLFRASGEDVVRKWLLSRMQQPGSVPLAIVVDGWGAGSGERVLEDMAELLQLCEGNGIAVVAAVDEAWFETIRSTSSGQASSLGRLVRRIDLHPLSYPEFEQAAMLIEEDGSRRFVPGSQYNADYRHPRILRMLIALTPKAPAPIVLEEQEQIVVASFPAVTGPSLVRAAWSRLGSSEVKDDLLRFAKALLERPKANVEPRSTLMLGGVAAITLEAAEEGLGEARLRRLIHAGLASYLSAPDGERLVYPRVPELIAGACANVISRTVKAARIGSEGDVEGACNAFLASCECAPLSDVVGAMVLEDLADDSARVSRLAVRLLVKRPTVSTIGEGAEIASPRMTPPGEANRARPRQPVARPRTSGRPADRGRRHSSASSRSGSPLTMCLLATPPPALKMRPAEFPVTRREQLHIGATLVALGIGAAVPESASCNPPAGTRRPSPAMLPRAERSCRALKVEPGSPRRTRCWRG